MSKLKTEPTPPAKGGLLTRDVKSIARNGSASIGELRDFMARMKGKGAGEVLGEIAKSGLARGVALSCAIFAVLLVVFTVGPFLWGLASPSNPVQSTLPAAITASINPNSPQAVEEAADAAATDGNNPAGAGTLPSPGGSQPATPGTNPANTPDPDDLLKQLNLDGEKNGAPATNPFGNSP